MIVQLAMSLLSYITLTSTCSGVTRLRCAARPEEKCCLLASCIIALITQSKGFALPVSTHGCTFTCNFNFYFFISDGLYWKPTPFFSCNKTIETREAKLKGEGEVGSS